MKYLIVKDRRSVYFHVMKRKHWWNRWKYCRAPIKKGSNELPRIWRWDTEKGAQAFINQSIKNEINVQGT
jgi:hypothetical protein